MQVHPGDSLPHEPPCHVKDVSIDRRLACLMLAACICTLSPPLYPIFKHAIVNSAAVANSPYFQSLNMFSCRLQASPYFSPYVHSAGPISLASMHTYTQA